MRLQRLLISNCVGLMLGISLLVTAPAQAHGQLNSPNGGEELTVGCVITVERQILIAHNLLNWDLHYSVTGPNGPWIPIALNLPAGNGAVGSIHTYDWTVPGAASDQVRVRVIMDNNGADLLLLLAAWGPCEDCKMCPEDFDDTCSVSTSGLLILLANWG